MKRDVPYSGFTLIAEFHNYISLYVVLAYARRSFDTCESIIIILLCLQDGFFTALWLRPARLFQYSRPLSWLAALSSNSE